MQSVRVGRNAVLLITLRTLSTLRIMVVVEVCSSREWETGQG